MPEAMEDRIVPMKVIICGLHRTGTTSNEYVGSLEDNLLTLTAIKRAMSNLGIHDCHHMNNVIDDVAVQAPLWIKALEAKYANRGSMTKREWDRLLGKCQACCDRPAALFSAELAQVYPDAKVIILSRDPEEWYLSVLNTIGKEERPLGFSRIQAYYAWLLDPWSRTWIDFISQLDKLSASSTHIRDKEKAIAWFHSHYQEVRDRVPAERRLEYDIKDGWEPLCNFLGLSIPSQRDPNTNDRFVIPFPRENDPARFEDMTAKLRKAAMDRANKNALAITGKMTVLSTLMYCCYRGASFLSRYVEMATLRDL